MKKYKHLSEEEREEIFLQLLRGKNKVSIAEYLRRDPSTIGREINRNKTMIGIKFNNNPKAKKNPNCYHYLPNKAQIKYKERRSESNKTTPLKTLAIYKYVTRKLKEGLSPDLISGRAKLEGIGDISHEGIYQFIYSLEGRRLELYKYLARKHKRRKKKIDRKSKRTLIPNRIGIEERSKDAEERKEFGHWETDSVLGARKRGALNTNRERKTRYMIITKIQRKTAEKTKEAIVERFKYFPQEARKSNTADNGSEFVKHEEIRKETRMIFYFANPYHSWERGTNENGNGIIRRFYPKRTDFDLVKEEEIQKLENYINNRPMRCLGYKTPKEVFLEELEKTKTLKYIRVCRNSIFDLDIQSKICT